MSREVILLMVLTAACASGGQGAPISYGGGGVEAPAASSQAAEPEVDGPEDAPPPQTAQAAPDWADGEGRALSAYALQAEDAQPFDPAHLPPSHRVRENESLYDIATTYQVPLRALIDQNHLEPPYALAPGRELQLPPPRFHTLARGETFEEVAQRYNVDLRSLALLNRMQAPYRVRQGERIVLPAMARAVEVATPPPPVARRQVAGGAITGAGLFAWPLRGEVVARFGTQPNGARLDGVEIAGLEGAPVAAAADGDVVYAGSDLPAYGTLVLLRHGDDYVTAYGYARRALVREGQHVRAGEAIAELGPHAGGAPRLLFQVRRGAVAVDPTPLLGQ